MVTKKIRVNRQEAPGEQLCMRALGCGEVLFQGTLQLDWWACWWVLQDQCMAQSCSLKSTLLQRESHPKTRTRGPAFQAWWKNAEIVLLWSAEMPMAIFLADLCGSLASQFSPISVPTLSHRPFAKKTHGMPHGTKWVLSGNRCSEYDRYTLRRTTLHSYYTQID